MKKIIKSLFLILLISILLIFFILILMIEPLLLLVLAFPAIMGLFIFGLFYVCLSFGSQTSSMIDEEKLSVTNIDEKRIRVVYESYEIDISLEELLTLKCLPEKENSLSYPDRCMLCNYLKEKYQTFVPHPNLKIISNDDIPSSFPSLHVCSDQEKKEYRDSPNPKFRNAELALIGIAIVYIISIVRPGSNISFSIWHVLFILLLIVFVVQLFSFKRKDKKTIDGATLYTCDVFIYDKKRTTSRYSVRYYARVWDQTNHLLDQWIQIDQDTYLNGNEGNLYYWEKDGKCIGVDYKQKKKN